MKRVKSFWNLSYKSADSSPLFNSSVTRFLIEFRPLIWAPIFQVTWESTFKMFLYELKWGLDQEDDRKMLDFESSLFKGKILSWNVISTSSFVHPVCREWMNREVIILFFSPSSCLVHLLFAQQWQQIIGICLIENRNSIKLRGWTQRKGLMEEELKISSGSELNFEAENDDWILWFNFPYISPFCYFLFNPISQGWSEREYVHRASKGQKTSLLLILNHSHHHL